MRFKKFLDGKSLPNEAFPSGHPSQLETVDTSGEKRLDLIPPKFREAHLFCFWLHDQMLNILRQAEERRVADVLFQLKDDDDRKRWREASDPLQFLYDTGRDELAKDLVLRQTVIPLYGDILSFIFVGLKSLERRRFAVSFALFRKPLRYNLMLASWLLAKPDDFYEKYRASPADHLNTQGLSPDDRVKLLDSAIQKCGLAQSFDAKLLYGLLFDKSVSKGLAVAFDKATHPVTSFPGLRTEPLNLNFIFNSPNDMTAYENLYWILAHVLIYLAVLQLALVETMHPISEKYRNWFYTATFGVAEALFADAETPVAEQWSDEAADLLKCVSCGFQMRVTRDCALDFFLNDVITCHQCKSLQQFPFSWLILTMGLGVAMREEATGSAEGHDIVT